LQVAPFQCRISVVPPAPPAPTAHTSLVDTTVTDDRLLVPLLGVVTTVHWTPSQCRANVLRPSLTPTAHTSFVEAAATPAREPPPNTPGAGTMLHTTPSQCIMSMPSPTVHTSLA